MEIESVFGLLLLVVLLAAFAGVVLALLFTRPRYLITVRWSTIPPSAKLGGYNPRFTVTHTVKQGEDFPMPQITVEHPGVRADATLKTAAGNPAPWDEQPVWTLDREDVVAMTALPTGTDPTARAEFRPLPIPEGEPDARTVQVTLEGDADLGSGVRPITAVGTITVTRAEGVIVELQFTDLPTVPTP